MKNFTKKAICIALSISLSTAEAGQVIGQYKYNIYGEVTQSIDTGGKSIKVVAYNVFGQPTAIVDRALNVSHSKYDENGNLIASWIDKDQSNTEPPNDYTLTNYLIKSQYDQYGRIVQVRDINGSIDYTYYPDGQSKSVTYNDNSTQGQSRAYVSEYDRSTRQTTSQQYVGGKLTYQTVSQNSATGIALSDTVTDMVTGKVMLSNQYFYEDPTHPQRLTKTIRAYTSDQGILAHKLVYILNYDMMGKASGITVNNDQGQVIYHEAYLFDDSGNIRTFTQDYGQGKKTVSDYQYGISPGANDAAQVLLHYTIDPSSTVYPKIKISLGNTEQWVSITGQDYQYTENLGLKQMITHYKTSKGVSGQFTYVYSYAKDYPDRIYNIADSTKAPAGNFEYDANGNVKKDQWDTQYIHNPLNQLIEVKPGADTDKSAVEYSYTTSGMVKSSIPQDNPSQAVFYHYLSGKLVGQTQQAADGSEISANYFSGATLYDPDHEDHNRINITNYRSDVVASQSMKSSDNEQYLYTPYGAQTTISKSLVNHESALSILDNIFGYTNQIFDPSVKGNFMGGKRVWDPNYGISITHDTINVDNPYMTMRGNPMAYIDPTGNMNWGLFGLYVGLGVLGIGLAVLTGGASFAAYTAATSSLGAAGAGAAGVGSFIGGASAAVSTGFGIADAGGIQNASMDYWHEKVQTPFEIATGIASGALTGGGLGLSKALQVGTSVGVGIGVGVGVALAGSAAAYGGSIAGGKIGEAIAGDEGAMYGSALGGLVGGMLFSTGLSVHSYATRSPKSVNSPIKPLLDDNPSSLSQSCFVAGTLVWVRRRKVDGSSRFFAEMFSQYDIIELEVEGQRHEIILLPIEMIEIGDEVLSMPEDYRPELDQVA